MTCSATTLPTSSLPAQSALRAHGIAGIVKGWWGAYWARRAERTTVLMLQALDDSTLRDIGLGRSEIESVVYGRPRERTLRYRSDLE